MAPNLTARAQWAAPSCLSWTDPAGLDMGRIARVLLFAILSIAGALPAFAQADAKPPAEEESRNFTTSDGVRLHYIAKGAGETLVFVPGWLMPAEIWRPQINHFASQYRVIALDPRSQGDSEIAKKGNNIKRRAEDLHELIEHTQSSRVVLVGWSLGVMEALLYVKTHGDAKVAALVLVDNSVGETPPQEGGASIQRRPPNQRDLEMAEFVSILFRTRQTPAYLEWLTKQVLRTPPAVSASLVSIPFPRTFWRSAVYSTKRPLLYAVTAGLGKQADTLRRKRMDTWTEVFPAAGHALFVDDAERFNAVVDAFLVKALKGNEVNK
jgi:non-heme chloroperoxidase